jgi:NDP-4-keto-2,6-dideoxyhexose 3-C-methyltransferase
MATQQLASDPDLLCSTRTTCRSCLSPRLDDLLSLGQMQISDFLDANAEEKERKVPLELVLCPQCSLVQLRHTTRPDLLWKHYWYRSGINTTMRHALAEITARARAWAPLRASDIVLDIGCNDGTLLRTYPEAGIRKVGFEPAANLVEEASVGTTRILNDFFHAEGFRQAFGEERARIITSISMFYDLEDPNAFVHSAARCLRPDGLWIIQMNYLVAMMEKNAFDNIGHEHLEYYSLYSLRPLLERHGLKILDVETTDLNGGSFRIYIAHAGSELQPAAGAGQRIAAMEQEENRLGLSTPAPYLAFAARVERLKSQVAGFVKQEVAKGKTVYAYGASTRGSTLLQYFGLDRRHIRAAVERSPHKFGKKTSGTWIPILSEEQARADRPDYMLVLPYFFLDEFLEREREYLAGGGKFLVPVPEFRILPD